MRFTKLHNLSRNFRTFIFYGWLWMVSPVAFSQMMTGAEQISEYLPYISGKKIAVVVNPTSVVKKVHLVDTLSRLGIKIERIFAPEHGFRGDQEAGKKIKNSKDKMTGIPVISLYGKKVKPSAEDLKGIEYVVFDIQDVGVRYYTYLSTLNYVMEACAENQIPLLVLDRPNPNGHYIDGPVLDTAFRSFVGLHPVPVVYGLTIGEYAKMIQGEKWLKNGMNCPLTVMPLYNYSRYDSVYLSIPPSPNLRSMEAIYLYPSLGFFEGTDVSVGRGTSTPFELIGKPDFEQGAITFTPQSIKGVAENPPYLGKECKGYNVKIFGGSYVYNSKKIYMYWLIGFYEKSKNKEQFFNPFFDKLAGTDQLRIMIQSGKPINEIVGSWQKDLDNYSTIRKKYMIYPD